MNKQVAKLLEHATRHREYAPNDAMAIDTVARASMSVNSLRIHHPDLLKKARAVEGEIHKARGLARFVPYQEFLIGHYHAYHRIEDLVGFHFKKRFPAFNVVTFNQARGVGTISFVQETKVPESITRMLEHVDVLGLHWFKQGNYDEFLRFAGKMLSMFYGSSNMDANGMPPLDDSAFIREWNAYYGTQCIDSRINYKYAMKMLGKRYLLDSFGHDSIVTQRVYKKIGKDQKTLLDFDTGDPPGF